MIPAHADASKTEMHGKGTSTRNCIQIIQVSLYNFKKTWNHGFTF